MILAFEIAQNELGKRDGYSSQNNQGAKAKEENRFKVLEATQFLHDKTGKAPRVMEVADKACINIPCTRSIVKALERREHLHSFKIGMSSHIRLTDDGQSVLDKGLDG